MKQIIKNQQQDAKDRKNQIEFEKRMSKRQALQQAILEENSRRLAVEVSFFFSNWSNSAQKEVQRLEQYELELI